MRLRLAITIAVLTLALVLAANASAAPTALAPVDGAGFPAGGSQIGFSAQTAVVDPTPPPAYLEFHISKDNVTDSNGRLTNFFYNIGSGGPDANQIYQGATDPDASWPTKPRTYWWQAVDPYCTPVPATETCVSEVRSLVITPLPAAAVTNSNQVETFLGKRPRHRTHRRKVKFSFSSNVTGATFECLFAKGWAKCRSPHVFRHLRRGRYKFEVRAVVNGIEDPDPQTWYFRVLRHRRHHHHH